MNHVCVLLHGIECDPKDRIWSEEVEAKFQPGTFIRLMARKYGDVGAFGVWFSAFARRRVVDHEEAYFRCLQDDLGLDGRISVVGHSLGGYIVTALLKRGIKFYKIAHLWGSTVSNFNWRKVEDDFTAARVYWSPEDEVLTESSVATDEDPELGLGLMGKEGPRRKHPSVEPIKTNWTHNQFMDYTHENDEFWLDIFEWMEVT